MSNTMPRRMGLDAPSDLIYIWSILCPLQTTYQKWPMLLAFAQGNYEKFPVSREWRLETGPIGTGSPANQPI